MGATGESVGAIAVCVTLIFLTIQLRQANGSRKTVAYQTYLGARTEWLKALQQPEISQALVEGAFAPTEANEEALQRFHQVLHLSMTYFASAHSLWKDGLLSDDEWQSNLSMLAEFKGTEGFRLWWPAVNNFYGEDFIREIESVSVQSTGLERFLENVQKSRSQNLT
jgi:hypothetical protein